MREMKDSGIVWIGEIPSAWELGRLKYAVTRITDQAKTNDGYIGLENVESGSGKHLQSESAEFLAEGTSLKIDNGDVIFGKLRPYLAKCMIVKEAGCCSTEFIVMKPRGISASFLQYILLAPHSIDAINMSTYGAKMPRANWDFIGNLPIPRISEVEQYRIAAYLDRRCATIDALIANQQQQIDKLKQYKQAVITEAVTRGLDPNVRMKDSGVEWIGDVPENWTICRIADLYSERSESGNDSLPILTVSINSGISDRELSNDEQDRVFIRSEDKSKYKRVYPGDLAYNMMRAWQGAFGAVRVDGMISPAYIVAKPRGTAEIDNRYFEALLRTPMAIEEMHRYSRGIMDFRLRLYWTEFRNIRVCLPSIDEQRSIADYLDTKCAQIDALIALKQQKADKLAEYKKSLIYEVVTGKREI